MRWQEIIGGTVWLPKPPKPQEPTKPADTRAPSKP